MITDNHRIAYRNVVSKYYNFLPEEIDEAIKDFVSILEELGFHPIGAMFFSIISDPSDKVMTAEIFLSIEEDNFNTRSTEQFYFRSYFSIDPMIMTRVMDDFDTKSQDKYWELINYIKRNGLEQRTPVFVEYKRTHAEENYVEMSVGVK
ncbi:DUF5085 family protein [Oceanobacillus saliphilus]|uniref:DUF5085 family protein n=1 Tax=Oceanobacillus saliphilus TaxID=2925834 RepID=UPI00201D3EB0|nr:DUF5085 family protein [Oceanobacillus saliphilus]